MKFKTSKGKVPNYLCLPQSNGKEYMQVCRISSSLNRIKPVSYLSGSEQYSSTATSWALALTGFVFFGWSARLNAGWKFWPKPKGSVFSHQREFRWTVSKWLKKVLRRLRQAVHVLKYTGRCRFKDVPHARAHTHTHTHTQTHSHTDPSTHTVMHTV